MKILPNLHLVVIDHDDQSEDEEYTTGVEKIYTESQYKIDREIQEQLDNLYG